IEEIRELCPCPLPAGGKPSKGRVPQRCGQRTILVVVPQHFVQPDTTIRGEAPRGLLEKEAAAVVAVSMKDIPEEYTITRGDRPWRAEHVHAHHPDSTVEPMPREIALDFFDAPRQVGQRDVSLGVSHREGDRECPGAPGDVDEVPDSIEFPGARRD